MYEYKVIVKENPWGFNKPKPDAEDLERTINEMAEEGYELDQVVPTANAEGQTRSYTLVFKKEKQ